MSLDYKKAGVDIAAGDSLVEWIKSSQPKDLPHADQVISGIGGFASLFRLQLESYKDPCLVTCTDGVGTKLKLAVHFDRYETVGQDLVAMSVNDMICSGADPLLFLDYYASGKLELPAAKEFIGGVRQACIDSNCLLIGGETAEMPGVYHDRDFDCAGFAVGVVDRVKAWGPHRVQPGQTLVAIESHGFHSNGFSLLRQVFAEDLDDWKEELLRPTALYVKLAQALKESVEVAAVAHITGGGIDNILRAVPAGCNLELDSWKWPEPFAVVQDRTGLSDIEMIKTLNCGIGLVLIVPSEQVEVVQKTATDLQFHNFTLGKVVEGQEKEAPGIQFLKTSFR